MPSHWLCSEDHWVGFKAGTSCVDHAMYGKLQRSLGPTGTPFQIFIAAICTFRPHFFLTEITAVQTEYLVVSGTRLKENGYLSMTLILCPTRNGEPSKRSRRYFVGCLDGEGVRFHETAHEREELCHLFARLAPTSSFAPTSSAPSRTGREPFYRTTTTA